MFRFGSRPRCRLHRSPCLVSLCAAGSLLLPIGCNMPMSKLLQNGPTVPGPFSSGLSPPLDMTENPPQDEEGTTTTQTKGDDAPVLVRTAYAPPETETATLPAGMVLNLDTLLKVTCERNARILQARERVNESQAAYDAAVSSCVPQFLRKDTFKTAPAEAELWRRRAELQRTQNEVLQDAANTYFDWMTAQRGEAFSRDLEQYFAKLLKRAQALVDSGEKTAQVLVEAIQTGMEGLKQSIARTNQQTEAAAVKLNYLMGKSDGPLIAGAGFGPVDFVDANAPVAVLVKQAQENGPGVRELQGLIAAIQKGIDDARCAQHLCNRTGAAQVCGRLRMAQSELQQAQLALIDLHGRLQLGVEEAVSAILSGREQVSLAKSAIQHGTEAYRINNLRLESESPRESMQKNTYNAVLTSIQQLSQAQTNYLTSVNSHNKAEARLLLLLGTYNDCKPNGHGATNPLTLGAPAPRQDSTP
jgi:outer membrane protein TolC